jgi:hypothetical protein
MITAVARIDSYFSLPTDLAAAMRAWPEFASGEGYHVELEGDGERVSVCLVLPTDDDCQHVLVQGTSPGRLFHSVLGQVSYALAEHSDNVSVCQWSAHEVQPGIAADGFAAR